MKVTLPAGGATTDDNTLWASLKAIAKQKGADKMQDTATAELTKSKWQTLTAGVSTPQLVLTLATDRKIEGKTADSFKVIIDKLSEMTPPVSEQDGQIMNMRQAAIELMIKAEVDPSEHFVAPKQSVELVRKPC